MSNTRRVMSLTEIQEELSKGNSIACQNYWGPCYPCTACGKTWDSPVATCPDCGGAVALDSHDSSQSTGWIDTGVARALGLSVDPPADAGPVDTNGARVARARKLLHSYAIDTGSMTRDGAWSDDVCDVLSDLLADLMHLAGQPEFEEDFGAMLSRARKNFREEQREGE